jgi:hypothetical protein
MLVFGSRFVIVLKDAWLIGVYWTFAHPVVDNFFMVLLY